MHSSQIWLGKVIEPCMKSLCSEIYAFTNYFLSPSLCSGIKLYLVDTVVSHQEQSFALYTIDYTKRKHNTNTRVPNAIISGNCCFDGHIIVDPYIDKEPNKDQQKKESIYIKKKCKNKRKQSLYQQIIKSYAGRSISFSLRKTKIFIV